MRHFWRVCISGVVLAVDVLLLLGPRYCSGTFVLSFIFFFWLCASVVPLGWSVVAETGCNWYLLILIYFFYRKIERCHNLSVFSVGVSFLLEHQGSYKAGMREYILKHNGSACDSSATVPSQKKGKKICVTTTLGCRVPHR
jgi:hypothetical protein